MLEQLIADRLSELSGATNAIRFVLCAVIKSHPDKAKLQEALQEIHKKSAADLASLDPKVQAAFDTMYAELSSHML